MARLLTLACFSVSLSLGTTRPVSAQTGLVIVAHGADSGWNAAVEQVIAQVKWAGPVQRVFLMGPGSRTFSWDAGVATLVRDGATRIVAVPLMVSTHGSHVRQVQHYAGLGAMPPELAGPAHHHAALPPPVPIRVSTALDASPELGDILVDRWRLLSPKQQAQPLVLVAHGPGADEDVPLWEADISGAMAPLAATLPPGHLRVGLLRDDAPPEVRAAAIRGLRAMIDSLAGPTDSVTVMTVLISRGAINRITVPRDLAGLPIHYVDTALAPHPALARWIERIAMETSGEQP